MLRHCSRCSVWAMYTFNKTRPTLLHAYRLYYKSCLPAPGCRPSFTSTALLQEYTSREISETRNFHLNILKHLHNTLSRRPDRTRSCEGSPLTKHHHVLNRISWPTPSGFLDLRFRSPWWGPTTVPHNPVQSSESYPNIVKKQVCLRLMILNYFGRLLRESYPSTTLYNKKQTF